MYYVMNDQRDKVLIHFLFFSFFFGECKYTQICMLIQAEIYFQKEINTFPIQKNISTLPIKLESVGTEEIAST